MKRRAISRAEIRGRDAGRQDLAAGLNPYPAGSRRAEVWQSARLKAIDRRLERELQRK